MQKQSTEPYQQSVAILIIILNTISLASLCFVLGIYVYNWKKIASFPMRLSFYLCIACLGQNIYVILLNPITIHDIEIGNQQSTSGYCIFQGILKVFFDLSSIIWTSMITFSIYASVVMRKEFQSKQIMYLFIAYGIPLVAACIPAFFNQYGYVQYFCWFNNTNTQFWMKMGYYFIPLWVLFIFNLTLAIKTYYSLKRLELQPRLLTIFKRLMWFPFIMFITGFVATIDQIYSYATNNYLAWLDGLGLVLLSLYGFFNSLAYGFNPLIREKIEICLKGKDHPSTVNQSRYEDDDVSNSSRNTERIEAELYEVQSRKQTEGILVGLKK